MRVSVGYHSRSFGATLPFLLLLHTYIHTLVGALPIPSRSAISSRTGTIDPEFTTLLGRRLKNASRQEGGGAILFL
jgi:hypothetical protein